MAAVTIWSDFGAQENIIICIIMCYTLNIIYIITKHNILFNLYNVIYNVQCIIIYEYIIYYYIVYINYITYDIIYEIDII